MRIALAIAALSLTLFAQEQEIDRIAVVVNRQPITMGEWEQQERFEALSNSEPWNGVQHSRAALDRLIDRSLILEQMQQAGVARADATATAAQLSAFRTQIKLNGENEWRAALKRYGLLEADVADIIAEQTDVLHFMEQRFRPAVHVAPEDVRRYYRQSYLPEFTRTARPGTKPPALEQVQSQIIAVLAEQRMNDLFTAWLKNLRAQANIRHVALESK
jgi:hypothetical protein